MAIIIPSKHIYEKQNQKVIDNVIDRIEVKAQEVLPDNQYETSVYNNTLTTMQNGSSYVGEGFTVSYKTKNNPNPSSNEDVQYYATLLVGYQNITAITKKFEFYIPKETSEDHIITKLQDFSEEIENEDGTKNTIPKINFSATANKYVGTGGVNVEIGSSLSSLHGDNVTITERLERDFSKSTPVLERVVVTDLSIEINRKAGGVGSYPLVSQDGWSWVYGGDLPAQKNGTISVEISEDTNGYNVKTEIVCGAYLDNFTASEMAGGYDNSSPFDEAQELRGECIWYDTVGVEFTVYGNTVGINLKDKTVYINGETSKKVHSVEGNELLQTSNIYSGASVSATGKMYGDTQRQYANGKETATITCPIANYDDDVTGNVLDAPYVTQKDGTFKVNQKIYGIILQAYEDKGGGTFSWIKHITTMQKIYTAGKLYFTFQYTNTLVDSNLNVRNFDALCLRFYIQGNDTLVCGVRFDTENLRHGETYTVTVDIMKTTDTEFECRNFHVWEKSVSVDNSTEKMHFDIGDKVVPMVFGEYGVDKPMSKYNNGQPKVFEVLGRKFSYDGEPLQILELQEVTA